MVMECFYSNLRFLIFLHAPNIIKLKIAFKLISRNSLYRFSTQNIPSDRCTFKRYRYAPPKSLCKSFPYVVENIRKNCTCRILEQILRLFHLTVALTLTRRQIQPVPMVTIILYM